MSLDDKILDLSTRLLRELALARARVAEDRARLENSLASERRQLDEEVEQVKRQVQEERQALGCQITRVQAVTAEPEDEVLTLNVGGELLTTRRSTLCLYEGSYLANIFSGRWESCIERDRQGHFFLDFDPISFRLILNFLRSKRIESSVAPVGPPTVPPEREEHFQNLVEYLGLTVQLRDAAEDSERQRSSQDPLQQPLGASLLGSATAFICSLTAAANVQVPPTGVGAVASAASTSSAAMHPRLAAAAGSGISGSRHLGSTSVASPILPQVFSPFDPSTPSCGYPVCSEVLADAGSRGAAEGERMPMNSRGPMTSLKTTTPSSSTTITPGWSKKVAHNMVGVHPDDPLSVRIADTRALAVAAAVRSTRGFQVGHHSWRIDVELCSDWSYVGFVTEQWTAVSSPVGRAHHSWGVSSNGTAWAKRKELRCLQPFSAGSCVAFIVDLGDCHDRERRTATIVIDRHEFRDVFSDLPTGTVYPAVSNCRSPARYALTFLPSRGLEGKEVTQDQMGTLAEVEEAV